MEYYSIGEFAKLIKISVQTLRAWDKTGKLKPHHTSFGKHRYYSHNQLMNYLGLTEKENHLQETNEN